MHIADGVLPISTIAAGWAGTAVVTGLTLRRVPPEELPKAAVMTAGFFVASLIHVPLGPTSVHLILNGLVGMVLGPRPSRPSWWRWCCRPCCFNTAGS